MIRPPLEKRIFETESGPSEIALFDILWADSTAEGAEHPTCLHLADRTVLCTKPFESLRPLLGDAFLFCLPYGAVNQLRIRSFESDKIVMDNGEVLEIAPFLSRKFREKFCRELARRVWED